MAWMGTKMRLINSDGQVEDARVITEAKSQGSAAAGGSVRIELGGLALVACIVVMLLTTAVAVLAYADSRHTRDLLDVRSQSWDMAFARLNSQQHDTDTSAKLLERRYMDFTAYAELNGWDIRSTDKSFGPTGNIERMVHKEKRNGR